MLKRFCLALAGLLLLVSVPSAQSPDFRFPSTAVTGRVLSVPAGTWNVAATYAWPNDVQLQSNAKLVIPSGITLTIQKDIAFAVGSSIEVQSGGTLALWGAINAPPTQYIFQGAGTIQIAQTKARPEVYGEWFGVVSGGNGIPTATWTNFTTATANSAAFTKAFASFVQGGTVRLLNGYYWLDCANGHAITITGSSAHPKNLIGPSRAGTIIYAARNCPSTNYILSVNQAAEGAVFRDFTIKGDQIRDPSDATGNTLLAATAVTVGGILCTKCEFSLIERIRTYKIGNPFTLNSFSNSTLQNIISAIHSGTMRLGGGTVNDNLVQGAFAPRIKDVESKPDIGNGQGFIIDSGTADVEVLRLVAGAKTKPAIEVTSTSVNAHPPGLIRLRHLMGDQSPMGVMRISAGRDIEVHDSIFGTTIDPSSPLSDATTNTRSPFTIDSGSIVVSSSTTSGSTTVTPASLTNLAVGMTVTGSGIPAGTKVSSIPMQVGLSAAATATATSVSLTYTSGGVQRVYSTNTTSGSATVVIPHTALVSVGATVTGSGVPAGTTVQTVTPATTVTLSASATATATTDLTYGHPPEMVDGVHIFNSTIRGGGGGGLKITKGCNITALNSKFLVNGTNTTAASGGVEIDTACGLVEVRGNLSGVTGAPVSGVYPVYNNLTGTQDHGLVIGSGASSADYTNTWAPAGSNPVARHFRPRIFVQNNMLQGNVGASIVDNSTGWTAGCSGGANKCIANNMVD